MFRVQAGCPCPTVKPKVVQDTAWMNWARYGHCGTIVLYLGRSKEVLHQSLAWKESVLVSDNCCLQTPQHVRVSLFPWGMFGFHVLVAPFLQPSAGHLCKEEQFIRPSPMTGHKQGGDSSSRSKLMRRECSLICIVLDTPKVMCCCGNNLASRGFYLLNYENNIMCLVGLRMSSIK